MTDDLKKKEAEVMDVLRVVIDPEIGLNIVELGLVRKIEIGEDSAHLVMIMTAPFCPYAPQLLEQARKAAEDHLGVPTTVELSREIWDPTMMEEGAGGDWGLW